MSRVTFIGLAVLLFIAANPTISLSQQTTQATSQPSPNTSLGRNSLNNGNIYRSLTAMSPILRLVTDSSDLLSFDVAALVITNANVLDGTLTSADVNPTPSVGNIPFLNTANTFTQDQKIKSLDPSLDIDIDSTGLNGGIKAFNAGVLEGYLHYDLLSGEWRISNGTAAAVWGVDASTGVQSLGTVPGARIPAGDITDSHISAAGITTRTKLPSTLAYEDEGNVFTQNQTLQGSNPRLTLNNTGGAGTYPFLTFSSAGVIKSNFFYDSSNGTVSINDDTTGQRFSVRTSDKTLIDGTVPGARIPAGDINRAHIRLTDLPNASGLATDANGQIVAGSGVPAHDHTSSLQGGTLGANTVGTGQLAFQAVTFDKIGPSQVRNDKLDSVTGCSQSGYTRMNGWCMAVDGVGSLVIFSSGNGAYAPVGLTGFEGKIFIIGARMKKSSGGRGNFCIIPNLSSVTGCDSLSSSSTPVGAVINSVEVEVSGSILSLASSTIIGTTDSELKFFCSNTFGGSIECRAYVLGYM